jgi:hypothetical protein
MYIIQRKKAFCNTFVKDFTILSVLQPFIICGRVINNLTVLSKTRAVAGAIPGVLGVVVFESAS